MGGELMTQYGLTITEDEIVLLEDVLAYAREHFEADDDATARDFLNTVDLLLMKLALSHASEDIMLINGLHRSNAFEDITESRPRTTTARPRMIH